MSRDLGIHRLRTKKTEILYIFFGIHTANVVHLAGTVTGEGAGESGVAKVLQIILNGSS